MPVAQIVVAELDNQQSNYFTNLFHSHSVPIRNLRFPKVSWLAILRPSFEGQPAFWNTLNLRNAMSRSNRKQNYVDSHVQGALLRRICSHWLVFFFVSAFAIILLQTLLGDPGKTLTERLRMETGEFMFMAIVMLSLFPAFMLDTIRFSNRFVGPIGRVRRYLRQLSKGETDHCKFRDDDFWAELAEEFNQVADLVESQKQEITRLQSLVPANDDSVNA